MPSPNGKGNPKSSVRSAIEFLVRFGKEAETTRRVAKRREKARADLDKRREQLVQRMQNA